MNEEPILLARLDRIEAKLDRLLGGPAPEIMTPKDVMKMAGFGSLPTVYRFLHSLRVRPFLRGKYRRTEVLNAMARKSLEDRLAETVTEARINLQSTVNPHDD